jgi:3-deoxy-D-manno-octulosonate 8-phosphate phosphatase (KDO 8-P phosphatase)
VLDRTAARGVRLVVLDVDGVLTDNGIDVGEVRGERVEFKRFHAQDGLGVHLLRMAGLPVVWLTGRVAAATTLRAEELQVDEVIQDPSARKLPACAALLQRRGIDWAAVLYMGDDLADVPVLRRVGLAVSVPNGTAEARAAARWVTERAGGHGAVREMSEVLLRARGEWEDVLDRYYRERGDERD